MLAPDDAGCSWPTASKLSVFEAEDRRPTMPNEALIKPRLPER
jgi:hypothetical protein